LGTGHAVQMTLPVLPQDGISLILYGDVPLVRQQTCNNYLKCLAFRHWHDHFNVNPTGYGRIVRQNNQIQAIVEHKDASEEQRQIQEINTGIYCVSNAKLHEWLPNCPIRMRKVNIT
jgi:bifunctional UDP-N-acetylglucosamine pyrophosphorylase/glucosamine-1-phosphate N-acetyltransferase